MNKNTQVIQVDSLTAKTQEFIRKLTLAIPHGRNKILDLENLIYDTKKNSPEILLNLKNIDISELLVSRSQDYSLNCLNLLCQEGFFEPYSLKPNCSALDAFIKQSQPGFTPFYNQKFFDTLFMIFDKKLFNPEKEKIYCLKCISQKGVYPILKDLFNNQPREFIQKKINSILDINEKDRMDEKIKNDLLHKKIKKIRFNL